MQKFFYVLLIGVLSVFIYRQSVNASNITDDVLLENVEALANMENTIPVVCWDEGDCTCPNNGKKYKYIFEGYSLR